MKGSDGINTLNNGNLKDFSISLARDDGLCIGRPRLVGGRGGTML